MIETLQKYSEELIDALNQVKIGGPKNYITYIFDCSFFRNYTLENIRLSNEHLKYHEILRPINGPCIYWFEIMGNTNPEKIREEISRYREKNIKSVPAMRKNFDINSKALYVGKVKKSFWNRIIQHLGYYINDRTQGLQLYHWAEDCNLTLKLHVYEFENEMSNLMGPFEYKLARELRPILGKHS